MIVLPVKGLFKKQAELILSSQNKALLYTVILALVPYCTWLAMVVVALVTLRKGERSGNRVLLAGMLVHGTVSAISLPLYAAVFNTLIVFVPCYLSAYCLRLTSSWHAVAAVLFLIVMIASILIQQMIPEWVMSQFSMLQSLLQTAQPDQVLTKLLHDSSELPSIVMANFLLGIQLVSAVLSILTALLTARSLQSQLYYPGGFTQELLSFRGNRLSCLVMIVMALATWQWNVIAMNVLPVLILFYLLAGLSLCANFFIGKKSSKIMLVALVLPMVFLPFVMLPLYIILGMLDSVFNIRLALYR